MVPFQTFLALLLLLLIASSCSQVDPPHPDATTIQSQRVNPTLSPISPNNSSAWVDTQNTPGVARINLSGDDAQTLYSILPIRADIIGNSSILVKEGMQFTCVHDSAGYLCGFPITVSDGSIKIAKARESLVSEKPEYDQSKLTAPLKTNYLDELPATPTSSLTRFYLAGLPAETIYNALSIAEVPNGGGGAKDSDSLQCTRQPQSDGTTDYFCDLYLDVSLGAIDKPSIDGVFYQ